MSSVDPCTQVPDNCPIVDSLKCRNDYCSGCKSIYYDDLWNEVNITQKCGELNKQQITAVDLNITANDTYFKTTSNTACVHYAYYAHCLFALVTVLTSRFVIY